jgi:hypothetical protein
MCNHFSVRISLLNSNSFPDAELLCSNVSASASVSTRWTKTGKKSSLLASVRQCASSPQLLFVSAALGNRLPFFCFPPEPSCTPAPCPRRGNMDVLCRERLRQFCSLATSYTKNQRQPSNHYQVNEIVYAQLKKRLAPLQWFVNLLPGKMFIFACKNQVYSLR